MFGRLKPAQKYMLNTNMCVANVKLAELSMPNIKKKQYLSKEKCVVEVLEVTSLVPHKKKKNIPTSRCFTWRFPKMEVPANHHKSSMFFFFFRVFREINHPASLGYHDLGNLHIFIYTFHQFSIDVPQKKSINIHKP